MSRRRNHPLWGSRGTLALLSLVTVAAVAHAWAPDERLALPLYGLPVLFGAALFGRRGGAYALVLVTGVIVGLATVVRPSPAGEAIERWLPILSWGSLVAPVAWVTGTLRDRSRRRAREAHEAHLAFREALVRLVLATSGHTDERLARVADSAAAIARVMGADARMREEVHAATLLSGFAASDTTLDTITRAAGITMVRGGKRRGAPDLDTDDGFLERVTGVLACLRERWDGSGRLGLAGEAIPLGARVITVASAFDVAVHGGETAASAGGVRGGIARLKGGRGSQFDPAVVDVVLRIQTAEAEHHLDEVRRAS